MCDHQLPRFGHYGMLLPEIFFFSRIHPGRCTNHIEERARKPEPHVSLPTRGGSSPTEGKPNLHLSTKKEKAREIQRTPSGKA
jgi:hypothetical protein